MNDQQGNVIVGIDIGTTKICTLVGEYNESKNRRPSRLKIIGIGNVPGLGLKKGMVVNLDRTIFSIKNSIKEAKKVTGLTFDEAYISIAGPHVSSFNYQSEITIKNGSVSLRDVERAIDAAQTIILPEGRKILHILPQEFKVDHLSGIKDPIGMAGLKLTANIHVVTGAVSSIQNLSKCVEAAGVKIKNIVLQPLASSVAVLSEEEKNLGVALLDVGGGTSDLAVWRKGSLLYSQSLPIGGNHFTHDLSVALNTAYGEAEKIKIQYGNVLIDKVNRTDQIPIKGLSGLQERFSSIFLITRVLGLRAEELFKIINNIIEENNLRKDVIAGLVLTGGGSRIRGIAPLAESILNLPVKVGSPLYLKESEGIIERPEFSTAVGLLMVAFKKELEDRNKLELGGHDIMNKLNQSLKNIFKEIF